MNIILKLLPNLTPARGIFILFSTLMTIAIVEMINKKYFVSQGRWFKPKQTWMYLFVLSAILSLAVI